ncbi:hypothetical protein VPNG_05201 [Cytospora leucostoma]|uniref:Cytochrome P450 n=1 Tax=Cytospora leucostoma TaxID=1230097 RepID=A0A423X8A5_9PEZI|nr:hypothetical protein VPNG_05201 [Cytospora leucostoma]
MSIMLIEYALYASLAVVALAVCRQLYRVGRRPSNYPPGPPTLPIIGNLHQIPTKNRHMLFTEWARQYGPLYSLMLGSKVMIVINSDVVVKDLLDKKGAIYSSRPEAYMAQDVLSGGLRVLFMPDNGVWTMIRKLAHRILNVSVARTYVPYQDLENKAMLVGLLDSPDDFFDHLRRYTASLTTQMAFGFRAVNTQDPRFQEAFNIFDRSSELIASRTAALLDLVPVLRRLPGFLLPIKREGIRIHEQELRFFKSLYLQARKGLQDGTAKPSFSVDLINISKKQELSDDLAAYIGGSLLQAGSETTANILIGFVQAMVIFPGVARTAQAELDRVCGERMPDLNDVPNLPYIRACAKESFRWMPGFMLGIPHSVTQDDTYMGYHIPRGSTVIINVWYVPLLRFE